MSDENPFEAGEYPAVGDGPVATSYDDSAAASTYSDDDLRPDGDTGDGSGWSDEDGEVDLSDLRVNFSQEEAASESLVPIPPGKYNVAITKGSVKKSKSEKNPGKPFYSLEYTVQDGPYQGRKIYDNVMLFEGAAYSLVQLMKALGYQVGVGSNNVPSLAQLDGQVFIARVKIAAAKVVAGKEYDARNEVSGYFKAGAGVPVPAGASNVDPLAP